jgi:FlaA1/EpsC-like NDP-sugar epimerase
MFEGERILVTGGTGSIGSEIVRKLLTFNPEIIRVLSNDEDSIFKMRQELINEERIRFLIGDIRDEARLVKAMENINIVYHAAALKHVPLCEYNPFEAIKTNVLGTQNVINASLKCNVKRVINISTDKAVNPINTMGATKLLAEKLIENSNTWNNTLFSSVRFGNVLNTRGSIIPIWMQQINDNKKITVTDREMTRFVITIDKAIDLLFKATELSNGGDTFIFDMPALKIGDLFDCIKELYPSIEEENIGIRVGEKYHEELMTELETKKALILDNLYILPSKNNSRYEGAVKSNITNLSSDKCKTLNKDEIKTLLKELK